jgi:hypothetical protein
MTVINRNPTNKDLLQTNKFLLTFSRLPGMTFFCQSVNLPGVSLSEIPYNTPFVDLYVPGEKLAYDMLNVSFLIDEDMQSWQQIHDWIRNMTFPVEFKEYGDLRKLSSVSNYRKSVGLAPQYTDAILSIYTNKNNVNLRIKFANLFPVTLGSILFNAADNAEYVATADASFRFDYYNIERV